MAEATMTTISGTRRRSGNFELPPPEATQDRSFSSVMVDKAWSGRAVIYHFSARAVTILADREPWKRHFHRLVTRAHALVPRQCFALTTGGGLPYKRASLGAPAGQRHPAEKKPGSGPFKRANLCASAATAFPRAWQPNGGA